MPFILAADELPAATSWAQIASTIASLGFAVWYAYHATTKTIPRMNDLHAATVKGLCDEFRNEAKEQRAAESQRALVSAELARSGHGAMTQVTRAVDDLRMAIHEHGVQLEVRK